VTKKGNMFLYNSYGAWEGRDISPIEQDEAYEWPERNNCHEAIEKYFSDSIEEA